MTPKNSRSKTRGAAPPRQKPRRGKGRPVHPRDAVGRQRLIKATIDLLGRRAPGKVTLEAIARFARVDPKLIRYYFGDKNALFTAAVTEMLDGLQTAVETLLLHDGPARERIRKRISSLLNTLYANPHLHPLIVEQIMHGDREAGRQALKFMAVRGYSVTRKLIEEGVQRGELRQVDPRFLHVAMVGLCEYFMTARPLVQELFGRPMSRQMADDYAQFVAELLFSGLRAG